jgi:dTDP-4-amino-4,6-dideoxygalactose transaminase
LKELKKAITQNKSYLSVHFFGRAANSQWHIAKEYNLYVSEDNAQAIGANWKFSMELKKAGTIGHVGQLIFPSKILDVMEMEELFLRMMTFAHKLRGIVNHGMYERYHHDVVGVNSRLDIQAAVLNAKLPLLDHMEKRDKMQPGNIPAVDLHKISLRQVFVIFATVMFFTNIRCELLVLTGMV